MNTKNWFVNFVMALALLSIVAACSPQTQATNASPEPDLVVTFSNGTCSLNEPAKLTPGKVTVTLKAIDSDKEGYSASFVTLPSDKTLDDLIAASQGSDAAKPDWANEILFDHTGPASVKTANMVVETGPIYLVCFSWNDALNQPRYLIGYAGPVEVGK